MSWKVKNVSTLRHEFVLMAEQAGCNFSALCRQYKISRKTGYKWVERYRTSGVSGLAERSRRPQHSPGRSTPEVETAVLAVRTQHPHWGGRKVRHCLLRTEPGAVPSASTITAILHRHQAISEASSAAHQPVQRFAREHPNELWQMDFKGALSCPEGRCFPLTVLDDCSRFALAVTACDNQQWQTVQACLIPVFRQYGLPQRRLMDNGSPWGSAADHPYTPLTVWFLCRDIQISHGRPYHPQTQGKVERFHRTLKAELTGTSIPWPRAERQHHFETWRQRYNCERPHEAWCGAVPASGYQPSARVYPETLPEFEYAPGDVVRRVQEGGWIHYQGQVYHLPKAFYRERVALRADPTQEGRLHVFFGRHRIAQIDLHRESKCVTYVPEQVLPMSPD